MVEKPISKDVLAEQWFSFMHTLLARMQKAFRDLGMSQKTIAERLGKDAGYVSRCLSGRQNMTMRTIHDIARAMGCRLEVQFVPLASLPNPDEAKISTSHVERANLTMRMGMRRFTRLTNAHSKKYANHLYALALFFMHYNFVRQHKAHKLSPAMAAGLTDRLWSMEDIAERIDIRVNQPKARGSYKKRKPASAG